MVHIITQPTARRQPHRTSIPTEDDRKPVTTPHDKMIDFAFATVLSGPAG